MPVYVGVCRVELELDDNDSLKGKRSVVKSLIAKTRNKFNVAMAEVDAQDVHTRAVLGLAVIGNDKRYLNAVIDTIQNFVEAEAEAPVGDFQFSIEQFD